MEHSLFTHLVADAAACMHAVVMILQIMRTGEQVVTESTIVVPRTLSEVLLQRPHSGKIPVTVPTKRIHGQE